MESYPFIPLRFARLSPEESIARSASFYEYMSKRRTVRQFSQEPVPAEIIRNALLTAGTAPSGANMQPWHFVVVTDPALKKEIRTGAEKEEKLLYEYRASQEWLAALAPLGTNPEKSFLEAAPCLIVVFLKKNTIDYAGNKRLNYYTSESVGISTGLLIASLHQAGVATLTYTPNPMHFLNRILNRSEHEPPFMFVVAGYPASSAQVPDIERYPLETLVSSNCF